MKPPKQPIKLNGRKEEEPKRQRNEKYKLVNVSNGEPIYKIILEDNRLIYIYIYERDR